MCPFTKVEESFNIQAIHDVIHETSNVDSYDHLQFPGVVPRTFIGPLVLGALSSPGVLIMRTLSFDKLYEQYLVRGVLLLLTCVALRTFINSFSKAFACRESIRWFWLISASQFHIIFYSSRPLANTFALIPTLISIKYFLDRRTEKFVRWAAISTFIFRTELVLLFGPLFLLGVMQKRCRLQRGLIYGIIWSLVSILISTCIDSYFWKHLLWPEGEVLRFNVLENKSSQYGVMKWHWYFTSALPRAMLNTGFFVLFAIISDKELRKFLMPFIAFLSLYSILPHKELRFIMYVLPIFNAVAAKFISDQIKKRESRFACTFNLIASSHIIANGILALFFLHISYYNYPGGQAMLKLHELVPSSTEVHLHIDVYPAQTGVSRFLELNPNWIYNKTENIDKLSSEYSQFSHLLIEHKDEKFFNYRFEVLDTVFTYSWFSADDVTWVLRNPLEALRICLQKGVCRLIGLKPAVTIMKRREDVQFP